MKQHIFGFALFSFIVSSFAIIFAFLYAPAIPKIDEVKAPVYVKKPYLCRKKGNTVSYKVESSKYFADEGKIISRITLSWNGHSEAPKKVYLISGFFNLPDKEKSSVGDLQILEEPFKDSGSKTITIVSKIPTDQFRSTENIYASYSLTDESGNPLSESQSEELHEVTFVNGTDSIVKN
jgi:hypothetical protein